MYSRLGNEGLIAILEPLSSSPTIAILTSDHHASNFSYNSQVLRRKRPVLGIKLNPPSLLFQLARYHLACENIRFSSLFAAGDVSRVGTSATQRQKFHADDANQCLLNKSGSRGVPNVNLFNFRFLLINFGKVLCSSANELQQNSNACCREDYIPQILTVLLEIHRVYI